MGMASQSGRERHAGDGVELQHQRVHFDQQAIFVQRLCGEVSGVLAAHGHIERDPREVKWMALQLCGQQSSSIRTGGGWPTAVRA
jgi:hypothetical protein